MESERLSFAGAPPTDSPASLHAATLSSSRLRLVACTIRYRLIEAAALTVTDALASMQLRASRGVSRTVEACDTLLASLCHAKTRMKQAARTSFHRLCNKRLMELNEEADVNARLLDAVASVRDVLQLQCHCCHCCLRCSCVMWACCRLQSCCVVISSILC